MKLLYQLGALCGCAVAVLFWKVLPWWGSAAVAGLAAGCAYGAWKQRTPRTGTAATADAPGYDSFDTFDVGDVADVVDSFDLGSFED